MMNKCKTMDLMSVEFVNGGSFTSRGEWKHPQIVIKTTELIVVTEGSFMLEENGIKYSLSPGQGIFLSPDMMHTGVEYVNEKVAFYWIHFYINAQPAVKYFTLTDRYPVTLLCRQLLHYSERGFDMSVPESILRVLLAEIFSQIDTDKSDEALASKISSKICEWIRINSDRNLNVTMIAERFGYNEDYISRMIKSHAGRGLKALIDEYKMKYIKRLLLETEMSLAEIAVQTGFTDYKLFLKYFKYHEGITPTEFRNVYYLQHTNNR